MTNVHLVTGATGFVGGALTLELLDRTDDRVVGLVRARCDDQAQARLQASLSAAARAYGREDLLGEVARRCRATLGDILRPCCGADLREPVAEVWHCAASLKYEDDQAEEIFQHNVEGIRNMLDLARARRAAVFNHVSTAYVAGNRTGRILEELPHSEGVSNNRYEQSKIRAEWLVAAAEGVHVRILRPSIVIGHSRTYEAMSGTGMYAFISKTCRFQRLRLAAAGSFPGPPRVVHPRRGRDGARLHSGGRGRGQRRRDQPVQHLGTGVSPDERQPFVRRPGPEHALQGAGAPGTPVRDLLPGAHFDR